jgi:hypothetical protein
MVSRIVIGLLVTLVVAAIAFAIYHFLIKKKTKYSEVFDATQSNAPGSCVGTGADSSDSKSSSSCEGACDADKTCNGYDWDGTKCALFDTAPTAATKADGTHCYKKEV